MTENHNSNADGERPNPTPEDGQDQVSHASDAGNMYDADIASSTTGTTGTTGDAHETSGTHGINSKYGTSGTSQPSSTHQPSSTSQPSSTDEATDLDADWAAFAAEHAADLDDVASSRSARRFERHAQRKEKEALLSVNDLDAGTFTDDAIPLHQRGPRDHVGTSWLDTDDVMDRYGDDFVPPNPKIGHIKTSKLVFWILLIVGVVGIIGSVFVPALAAILGSVFGVCAVVGGAGLIMQHKGHTETRSDPFDDGARV